MIFDFSESTDNSVLEPGSHGGHGDDSSEAAQGPCCAAAAKESEECGGSKATQELCQVAAAGESGMLPWVVATTEPRGCSSDEAAQELYWTGWQLLEIN
ncbi:UNVERIFIED_CONTAM: hypothetical protein K2H54_050861 [Gekko kuhli]